MLAQFSFPIFLSLHDRHCLVIGYGNVGIRKLRGLLSSNPESVLVLDLQPLNAVPSSGAMLLKDGRVCFESRAYTLEDISKSFLVFACTNCRNENENIARLCNKAGILCNSASDPANGSFIIPALMTKNDVVMAISSGGASPALAKKWLDEQEIWLEKKSKFAVFLGKFRKVILEHGENSHANSILFRKIVNSPFENWFLAGNMVGCHDWLKQELPADIYYKAKEILYDLS